MNSTSGLTTKMRLFFCADLHVAVLHLQQWASAAFFYYASFDAQRVPATNAHKSASISGATLAANRAQAA